MFFSRCLAVPSVAASGGFSSPSVHLAQVLFRNEVECRASGSPAARIYTEDVRDTHHPPSGEGCIRVERRVLDRHLASALPTQARAEEDQRHGLVSRASKEVHGVLGQG